MKDGHSGKPGTVTSPLVKKPPIDLAMARPAGFSSDEEYSDDGLTLAYDKSDEKPPRLVFKHEEIEEDEEGEKLILAVIDGNINEMKKLVNEVEDLDLNYKSKKLGNWTALMHACFQGNVEIVKFLLKSGANAQDHFQLMTPLHCTCDSDCEDQVALIKCVDLLLEHGAVLKATDWYCVGVLSYAVRKNREKLVLKLLNAGCDVDSEDNDGWTPIFYAVDGGYVNLVQILKDAGASIGRIDQKGRTLYDIATAKFYKEIAEMVNTTGKLDIDDLIENYRDYKRMSTYEYLLSELPDKKKGRFHGFPSDAARWIYGIGLDTLVKLFMSKNVQLGEILTMDDQQLRDLGVIFSYERMKIRYCAQNFHQHSWGKNSLKDMKDDIDFNTAAQIIANSVRQLHLVSTATYFWKTHGGYEACRSKIECINNGLYYCRFMRKEIDTLLKIVRDMEYHDNIKACDLILPKSKRSSPWLTKKTVITTVLLVLVLYKTRKYLYPSTNVLGIRFPNYS